MQRPILSNMYETFIKIGSPPNISAQDIFQTIKTTVHPTIEKLIKDEKIEWYSFLDVEKDIRLLVHNRAYIETWRLKI